MKKQILYLIFILFVLSSFGQKTTKDSLILQLTKLKNAILSSDTQKVCSFFNFPIDDEIVKCTAIPSSERKKLNGKLNKKNFIHFYSYVIDGELAKFFSLINLKGLVTKDTIEIIKKTKYKKNTSEKNYSIGILEWTVEIHVGYRDLVYEKEFDDYKNVEWDAIWYFELIKGKLKFTKFFVAG